MRHGYLLKSNSFTAVQLKMRSPVDRSLAVTLGLLAITLPAIGRAQSSAALADTLARQASQRGELAWSASHPVTWSNFRGLSKPKGSTAAETASGVTYTVECSGSEKHFAVLGTFSPADSWVRLDVPQSPASEPILRHERTHFNITELFARQLRSELASSPERCPQWVKEAGQIFGRLKKYFDGIQSRYDRETAHGVRSGPQADWNTLVKAQLDSTAGYRIR